jgi:hypothetical protein
MSSYTKINVNRSTRKVGVISHVWKKQQLKVEPHHLRENAFIRYYFRLGLLTINTSQWAVSLIRSAVGPSTLPMKPECPT